MSPSFHPRLTNGCFGDPGVFVPFAFEKRAVLFDLGDLSSLSSRDILKITHVFVSHTHMDHFIGFDTLLRLFLGRDKCLHIFGPAGFLSHIEGKLAGYTWNLVENYQNRFEIRATEVHTEHLLTQTYRCRDRFAPETPPCEFAHTRTLLQEPALSIQTEILDHQIPCLGFRLEERFHVNIIKTAVEMLGLSVGPWLNRFKSALYQRQPEDSVIAIGDEYGANGRRFLLKELASRIARITPGQTIAYVSDAAFTKENTEKIISLARSADYFFIEAAFAEADSRIARRKYHLTASQAGRLAGQAGARDFTLFHFSPRYLDCEDQMRREAEIAYRQACGNTK